MKKIFSLWILLMIITSCVLGVVYIVVQQNIRSSANDPQIQMAEDAARDLAEHGSTTFLKDPIDISKSLAPFIMLYDKNGQVISFSPLLHNTIPQLPKRVLDNARKSGEVRLTWQPEIGVRTAAVVVSYKNGYVLAGRNLREVEKREDQLFKQIFVGWVATLIVSLIASLLLRQK